MKKGASHIEIILSFVIFILAVGFALYFFSPTNTDRLIKTTLDYTFREIEKNTTTIIKTYSIKINNNTIANDDPTGRKKILTIGLDKDLSDKLKSHVTTIEGKSLSSQVNVIKDYDGKILNFSVEIYSDNGWLDKNMIYVSLSHDFSEGSFSGDKLDYKPNYYEIGSSYSEKVLSWKKFELLNNTYYENYEELKKYFNIPNRVNFGFSLKLDTGDEIKAEMKIPEGFEVYSENKRIKLVKDNRITFGNLRFFVW